MPVTLIVSATNEAKRYVGLLLSAMECVEDGRAFRVDDKTKEIVPDEGVPEILGSEENSALWKTSSWDDFYDALAYAETAIDECPALCQLQFFANEDAAKIFALLDSLLMALGQRRDGWRGVRVDKA